MPAHQPFAMALRLECQLFRQVGSELSKHSTPLSKLGPLGYSPSVKEIDRKESERLLGGGLEYGPFRVRLAQTADDLDEVFKLRYRIFNTELDEGLPENVLIERDTDRYDPVCDHLLIEREGQIVGTYRILTSDKAKEVGGFYSETEFNIRSLPINFDDAIEVGRACIDPAQRKQSTLLSLFNGIHHYLNLRDKHYLFGLATLPRMSHEDAVATFDEVKKMGRYREIPGVMPLETMRIPDGVKAGTNPQIPPLVSVYFEIGSFICATPAYDPVFRAHDFLTLLEVDKVAPRLWDLFERFAKRQGEREDRQ